MCHSFGTSRGLTNQRNLAVYVRNCARLLNLRFDAWVHQPTLNSLEKPDGYLDRCALMFLDGSGNSAKCGVIIWQRFFCRIVVMN